MTKTVVSHGVLVREPPLLEDEEREDDRRGPRGPNQPRNATVGVRAPVPSIETPTGTMRTTVRLRTA